MRSDHLLEVYLFPEKSVVSIFSFQYLCRPEKIRSPSFFHDYSLDFSDLGISAAMDEPSLKVFEGKREVSYFY